MRCFSRRAVSGFVVQIGARHRERDGILSLDKLDRVLGACCDAFGDLGHEEVLHEVHIGIHRGMSGGVLEQREVGHGARRQSDPRHVARRRSVSDDAKLAQAERRDREIGPAVAGLVIAAGSITRIVVPMPTSL